MCHTAYLRLSVPFICNLFHLRNIFEYSTQDPTICDSFTFDLRLSFRMSWFCDLVKGVLCCKPRGIGDTSKPVGYSVLPMGSQGQFYCDNLFAMVSGSCDL